MLPCCPSKQGELPENMSQSLLLNLPPHPVHLFVFQDRLTIDCLNGWSLATGSLVWGFRSQNKMPKILLWCQKLIRHIVYWGFVSTWRILKLPPSFCQPPVTTLAAGAMERTFWTLSSNYLSWIEAKLKAGVCCIKCSVYYREKSVCPYKRTILYNKRNIPFKRNILCNKPQLCNCQLAPLLSPPTLHSRHDNKTRGDREGKEQHTLQGFQILAECNLALCMN